MTTNVRRRRSLAKAEGRQALGFATPALAGLAVFTIVPVVLSIVMSSSTGRRSARRPSSESTTTSACSPPAPTSGRVLRNTAVFTILYVPLNVGLSLVLAMALAPRIRGRGALRVLFFIPVVTPMVANVLVWKMVLLQPQGLFNGAAESWFGVTLPNFLADPQWAMIMVVVMSVWQGVGYNMLIFSAALEQLPESVMEAARIDGASGLRMQLSIVIPMISPAIFFATIMTMITAPVGLRAAAAAHRRRTWQRHATAGAVHLQPGVQVPGTGSRRRRSVDPLRPHHRDHGAAVRRAEEVGAPVVPELSTHPSSSMTTTSRSSAPDARVRPSAGRSACAWSSPTCSCISRPRSSCRRSSTRSSALKPNSEMFTMPPSLIASEVRWTNSTSSPTGRS